MKLVKKILLRMLKLPSGLRVLDNGKNDMLLNEIRAENNKAKDSLNRTIASLNGEKDWMLTLTRERRKYQRD